MRIKSMTPLSDNELNMIRDILTEANCVNEALRRTFEDGYSHMDHDTLYFGSHSWDYTYEVIPRIKEAR